MDWATVVTGVVGLAGIGGTLLSARMTGESDAANLRASIRAEDARARLAEKRRIYASCVGALIAFSDAVVAVARDRDTPLTPEQHAGLVEESDRARLAAQNAVSEVDLIAPADVAILAHRAMRVILHADEAQDAGELGSPIVNLTMAMRRDLGADDDSAGELVIAPAPEKPSKLA